jgi:hypothetical protein
VRGGVEMEGFVAEEVKGRVEKEWEGEITIDCKNVFLPSASVCEIYYTNNIIDNDHNNHKRLYTTSK